MKYKNYYRLLLIFLAGIVFCATSLRSFAGNKITNSGFEVLKFDFGDGKTAEGYQKVGVGDAYSVEKGFGWLANTPVRSVERKGSNALTGDFITSATPFYFMVNLPEGNYEIKIGLGDPEGESLTTIKAESRRLMLENVSTGKGETVIKTILVNVRTPQINSGERIRLKPREFSFLNWDDKLSLEFNNKKPCVGFIEIRKVDSVKSIFLAGNSTVVDQEKEPWASWGQMITNFFKPEIVVANFAESGEALLSFKGEKRLQKILSLMKKGDYLFIEFAHNDQKPGAAHLDAFTTYKDELKYFIREAYEQGGIPVLVTSMLRRRFDENGEIVNTLEGYPEAMRQTAAETGVALIDLNKMSKEFYEALGPEKSKKAFVHYPAGTYSGQTDELKDDTHFNPYGAYQLAKCIVQGIKDSGLDLKKYLKNDLPEYDPAKPDAVESFFWPESQTIEPVKPDGN
jgi:lysophospholipase L1-like esterase